MAFEVEAGPVLGVASGVALVFLAAGVASLRPRTLPSLSFGLFAGLWGATVIAANLSQMATDAATALQWARIFVLLYVPMYAPVLVFAAVYPRGRNVVATSPRARAVLAVPGFVVLAAAAWRPDLTVVATTVTPDGFFAAVPGPLFVPALAAGSVIAFAVALTVATYRVARARGDLARSQAALVVAAFLVYVAYRAGGAVSVVLNFETLAATGALALGSRTTAFVAAVAAVGYASLVVTIDRSVPWRRLLIAAAVVPFAAGAAEGVLAYFGFTSGTPTVGLWRLTAVALFAYAVARYRLFDLDVKIKWSLSRGTLAAFYVAGFFAVSEAAASYFTDRTGSTALGIGAAGVLVFFLAPLDRLARRLWDRALPGVTGTPAYATYRKFEVYRGAVEAVHKDGVVTGKERAVLDRLAHELDVAAADAAALEEDVKARAGVT